MVADDGGVDEGVDEGEFDGDNEDKNELLGLAAKGTDVEGTIQDEDEEGTVFVGDELVLRKLLVVGVGGSGVGGWESFGLVVEDVGVIGAEEEVGVSV